MPRLRPKHGVLLSLAVASLLVPGCVAQQSDLKKAEKDLQQQLSQTRARQNQEISTLREQELPQLRGELEKALHQARELQSKQEDFKHRSAQLEQQTKKLEQLAAKLESDSSTRYLWMQKSFETQDAKVSARLDELSKAMETLKKEVIDVVQRTNEGLAKRVDVKLEGHQKELTEQQNKIEQSSQKFAQFNHALTGFREALTGLNDRVGEQEQTVKHLASRIDADSKTRVTHAEEINRSVISITKALEAVGKKLRLALTNRTVELMPWRKLLSRYQLGLLPCNRLTNRRNSPWWGRMSPCRMEGNPQDSPLGWRLREVRQRSLLPKNHRNLNRFRPAPIHPIEFAMSRC